MFKVTPSGAVTILYSFCSQENCADGYYPRAGLMQASDGNVYGITVFAASGNCDNGCGTVFKITPSGTLTTLYIFAGYPSDPGNPEAVLVQASDGSFYGTTYRGGADNNCDPLGSSEGCGAVFEMTPSGTLTTLHSFNSTDGWGLDAGLIQARDGNFYGTTSSGDNIERNMVIHNERDGNFYGTTGGGGAGNDGTVFRLWSLSARVSLARSSGNEYLLHEQPTSPRSARSAIPSWPSRMAWRGTRVTRNLTPEECRKYLHRDDVPPIP